MRQRFASSSIQLRGVGMGAAFAREIARLLVLRDSPASVVHLDLSSNSRIRDEGIIALCPAIQHPECALVTLNLSSIKLGPSGAIALLRCSI